MDGKSAYEVRISGELGKKERKYPMVLRELDNAYESLGNYQKQLVLLTETLKIWEKHHPIEYLEIVITLNDLTRVYI